MAQVLVLTALLCGCATVPHHVDTPSGKAEVIIHSADIGRIKSAIVSEMVNRGYTVEADSTYQLEMSRVLLLGSENTSASWKTWSVQNTQKETFVLLSTAEGTRIVLSGLLQGKKTNEGVVSSAGYSAPLNEQKDIQADQNLLQLIKNHVEPESP